MPTVVETACGLPRTHPLFLNRILVLLSILPSHSLCILSNLTKVTTSSKTDMFSCSGYSDQRGDFGGVSMKGSLVPLERATGSHFCLRLSVALLSHLNKGSSCSNAITTTVSRERVKRGQCYSRGEYKDTIIQK